MYKLNYNTGNNQIADDVLKSTVKIEGINANMSEAEVLKILHAFAADEANFQQNYNLEGKIKAHKIAQDATYVAENLGFLNKVVSDVSKKSLGKDMSIDSKTVSHISMGAHAISSTVNAWATGNYSKPIINTALHGLKQTEVFGDGTAGCLAKATISGFSSSILFSPIVGLWNGGLSAAKCVTDHLANNGYEAAKVVSYGLDGANIANTFYNGSMVVCILKMFRLRSTISGIRGEDTGW